MLARVVPDRSSILRAFVLRVLAGLIIACALIRRGAVLWTLLVFFVHGIRSSVTEGFTAVGEQGAFLSIFALDMLIGA